VIAKRLQRKEIREIKQPQKNNDSTEEEE